MAAESHTAGSPVDHVTSSYLRLMRNWLRYSPPSGSRVSAAGCSTESTEPLVHRSCSAARLVAQRTQSCVMEAAERELVRHAREADGVVTTADAIVAGMSRAAVGRRDAAGTWRRVGRAVWLLPGFAISWRVRCRAALARVHPEAAVSHIAAARLWGWYGDDLLEAVHVTVPVRAGRTRGAGVVVHRADLPSRDYATMGGIPLTTPMRTVLDCARTRPLVSAVVVIESALRSGLVGLEELAKSPVGLAGLPGCAQAWHAFELADIRSESGPETELRLLLHENAIWWQPQILIGRHRVDLGDEELGVGAEVDGYAWHSDRVSFGRDRRRGRRVFINGMDLLHFTAEEPRRWPASTVRDVRDAIERVRRRTA